MDRKIYFFSGVAVLVLVSIFLIFGDFSEEDTRSFDELSAAEQREIVDASLSASRDEHYFSVAKYRDNNYFCGMISSSELKEECFDLVHNNYEP